MGLINKLFGNSSNAIRNNLTDESVTNVIEKYLSDAAACEKSGDIEQAISLYQKAADKNNALGQYKVGIYHKNSGDADRAFLYLQRAADNGHGGACYFMAQYYMDGELVPKNESQAFDYYKKSAELGDEAGQAYLGMFYLDGIGTEKDAESAYFWLSKCPDIDWSGYGLSKCYIYGIGTDKDINKGIKLLMDIAKPQSSNMFVKDARQFVRECALKGMLVPQSFIDDIDAADNRESELLDELIATFDEDATDDNNVEDNIVTLTGEDGNDVNYEFLDLISYNNQDFVILLPVEGDADEVVILKVEDINEEEENYVSVDDVQLLNTLFSIFKEKNKDIFNFSD